MIECNNCQSKLPSPCTLVHQNKALFVCSICSQRNIVALPPLDRLLVCLDQNALSEMMKLTNPYFPKSRRNRVSKKWQHVLDACIACRKSLSVGFPRSSIVELESSLHFYGGAINDMAEKLSGDTFIRSADSIADLEIIGGFKKWLLGTAENATLLPRKDAYVIDPNYWPSSLNFNFTFPNQHLLKSEVLDSRKRLHDDLQAVYDRWRKEDDSYGVIYNEEAASAGPASFNSIRNQILKHGTTQLLALNSPTSDMLKHLLKTYRHNCSNDDFAGDLKDYMYSAHFTKLPHVQIRSHLYASQSRRICGGMKSPPPSDKYDYERIISFLPYTDIFVLERHFAAIVNEILPKLDLELSPKRIFTSRNLDDLCHFLHSQTSQVNEKQLNLIELLYE